MIFLQRSRFVAIDIFCPRESFTFVRVCLFNFSTNGGSSSRNLSRTDLIDRVRTLEMRNKVLRNFYNKRRKEIEAAEGRSKSKYANVPAPSANRRHVALKISRMAMGSSSDGGDETNDFSPSTDPRQTLSSPSEKHLIRALLRTRLIDDVASANLRSHFASSKESNESVIGQIVTVDVKTHLASGVGVALVAEGATSKVTSRWREIPFASILNEALPDGLRVMAWAPLPTMGVASRDIDAATTTFSRFVPRGEATAEMLREAAKRILTTREISDDEIAISVEERFENDEYDEFDEKFLDLIELKVSGRRMSTEKIHSLFEDVIAEAASLDVGSASIDTSPHLVSSRLCLFHAKSFDHLNWQYDRGALIDAVLHFQRLQTEFAVKAAIAHQTLENIEEKLEDCPNEVEGCDGGAKERRRIVKRPYESPLTETMTALPHGYLTKNYDSHVDFLIKRRAKWGRRNKTE